jgi:DNA-binding LacI/PurR family transcriptional regulator
VGDWSARSGYEAGARIAADPGVTAVFAANDEMAVGVMSALADAGVSVPDEVSVVGFDGIPLAEYFRPALTTVRQDFDEIGRTLVEFLVRQIRDGVPLIDEHHLVPARLIERASTAGPSPRR